MNDDRWRAWREKHREAEINAALVHASLIKDTVDVDGHGCWNWLGKIGKTGYGYLTYGGKTLPAHRLSYIAFVGPFPSGWWSTTSARTRRASTRSTWSR